MVALTVATLLTTLSSVTAVEDHSYDTLDGVDRYTRFDKTPQPEDKDAAILFGGDVKCDVCEVIVTDILEGLGNNRDSDAISEALEADNIDEAKVESAPTDMHKHVEKKKRGCNKLFKDNFMAKGWDLRGGTKQLDPSNESEVHWRKAHWTFTNYTGAAANETQMNTYSVKMESLHYACENTIGKYRDQLARFLAKRIKKLEGKPLKKVVSEACKKTAKCEVRKPSESLENRVKRAEQEYSTRGNKILENFLKEEKAKKKAEKQAKKKAKKPKEAKKTKKNADAEKSAEL